MPNSHGGLAGDGATWFVSVAQAPDFHLASASHAAQTGQARTGDLTK
jgi:hypothetical protein